MKDLDKEFDERFTIKYESPLGIQWKYSEKPPSPKEIKSFIREREKELLDEVREKVTELKQEFDDSAWVSLKRYVKELLKELKEVK